MPKNSKLTEAERGKNLGLRIGGSSLNKIVKKLKLPKTTVYDTIKRYENAESLRSAPRSGCPCALNVSEQKTLREIALKNNRSSAEEIQEVYNKLIESMPRRIEACISNNGWPTEY